MISRLKVAFFSLIVTLVLRVVRALWRVERVGNYPATQKGPRLYAHWHGDELLLLPVFGGWGLAVMASRSKDGDLMARILQRFGYFVVRGSSSRGGAGALKGLVDAVRVENRSASIAVDGPRGPVFKAKPGILFLARTTGVPIIAAAGCASSQWDIKGAWNQGYLPKPFAKCVALFGEPLFVPATATDADLEKYRLELEAQLGFLKREARLLASNVRRHPAQLIQS